MYNINLLLLLHFLRFCVRWTSCKSHSFHAISASQAPSGDRTVNRHTRSWGRWSGSRPGKLSVKVGRLIWKCSSCWTVTNTALAHWKAIWVNIVSFLNYAFVSSLDQAFFCNWQLWTDLPHTPLVYFPLEHTLMDLQQGTYTQCWQIRGIQLNWFWNSPNSPDSRRHFYWSFLVCANGRAGQKSCCIMEFHVKRCVKQGCDCMMRNMPA